MYRLAIFDFDGTLADSAHWFVEAMNAAAPRFGYARLSAEEVEALRGVSNREIVRRLGIPAWKMPAIARHFRAEAERAAGSIRLFPGAAEALRALSARGVALAIVSSNSEATIRRVLGPDLAALVSHYGCGASLFGKAAKLRRAVRRSGIPAYSAVAIGDEARDIEAAREAGLEAAAVLWGFASRGALAPLRPAHLVGSFAELVDAVTAPPGQIAQAAS